jgi:tetraacyldisaccharide 4'-kinase
MEGDLIKIHEWLLPLGWLYGAGVSFRNWLFNVGLLHQQTYDIPVISVGNITVGGTGKTPHVEYLIRLLRNVAKVAVLSRGYKRKSHGYVLADERSTVKDIGDEPFQMKRKFNDIYVAVDAKRREGIDRLTHDGETKDVDVILLDDAFQHRYVKPGINILLVDYHRLIIYDKLLPAGRLREPLSGKSRADFVIITKCPADLKPMDIRVLTKAMNLYPYQELFFTTMSYGRCYPLYPRQGVDGLDSLKGLNVLLLTGIASPEEMRNDLENHCRSLQSLSFGDHHAFSQKDVENINETFASMEAPKVIITTEKDSTRLLQTDGLSEDVKKALYVQPIEVKFMQDQAEELFNNKIISYVRKNSRNSILAKRKDARTSHDCNHSGNRVGTISFRDN